MPLTRSRIHGVLSDADTSCKPVDSPSIEPAWWLFIEHLGPALRLMRIKFGIRQGELADALSRELSQRISQSYISRVERSKRGVSLARLAVICKYLDCTPNRVVAMAEAMAIRAARPKVEGPDSSGDSEKEDNISANEH